MSVICRNRALCVAVSVLNKCTMTRNSMADMVIEASDVGGAAGGTGDIVGGSVEVVLGIDDVVGASGIESAGSSSCCVCLADAGTRDDGLGGAASGAE